MKKYLFPSDETTRYFCIFISIIITLFITLSDYNEPFTKSLLNSSHLSTEANPHEKIGPLSILTNQTMRNNTLVSSVNWMVVSLGKHVELKERYKTQRSWELICHHFLYRLLRIKFLFDRVKWQPFHVFHFECHGRPPSLSRDLGPHEDLWQKISNWSVPCLRWLVSHFSFTHLKWHCKVSNYDPWLKATKPIWTQFSSLIWYFHQASSITIWKILHHVRLCRHLPVHCRVVSNGHQKSRVRDLLNHEHSGKHLGACCKS